MRSEVKRAQKEKGREEEPQVGSEQQQKRPGSRSGETAVGEEDDEQGMQGEQETTA